MVTILDKTHVGRLKQIAESIHHKFSGDKIQVTQTQKPSNVEGFDDSEDSENLDEIFEQDEREGRDWLGSYSFRTGKAEYWRDI